MCLPKYQIEPTKEDVDFSRKILIQSIQKAEAELELFKKWIKEKKSNNK